MSETITIYVTKYALTDGISVEAGRDCGNGMVERLAEEWKYSPYLQGKDWHRTMDAAVKRAEEMRVAKIKSLEKQIAKLRALKFGGA